MDWPLASEYSDAIQNPDACFTDGELKACHPETNAYGMPLVDSGGVAVVFQLRNPGSLKSWAVKCFYNDVPNLGQKYRVITEVVKGSGLKEFALVEYIPEGIRVDGVVYPVVKMEWVEGVELNEFVDDTISRPEILRHLARQWCELSNRLLGARLAHGDLQHGNVLVDRNFNSLGDLGQASVFRLVDYDGMFVQGRLDGSEVKGHQNYQHPSRIKNGTVSSSIDGFSELVIFAALESLAVGGRTLWDQYDNGENLLFRNTDFRSPRESSLLAELWEMGGVIADCVGHLALACSKPVDELPSLGGMITRFGRVPPLSPKEERKVREMLGMPVASNWLSLELADQEDEEQTQTTTESQPTQRDLSGWLSSELADQEDEEQTPIETEPHPGPPGRSDWLRSELTGEDDDPNQTTQE